MVAAGSALLVLLACAAGPRSADAALYVALGDSYTSAPGLLGQYRSPLLCLRSDRNYPSLVRAALHSDAFRDASCSSAQTTHMTAPQSLWFGTAHHRPQFDALSADATLVTIGIAANDVDLVPMTFLCMQSSLLAPSGAACRQRYGAAPANLTAATAPRIAALLDGVHERAPAARVLLVGYPAVLPSNGRGCYPFVTLSNDDVTYLDREFVRLNAMLAEQAAAGDAEFVDTYADSVGHDVCAPLGRRWFEGLLPTAIAFPLHPNDLGEASMARSVLRLLAQPRPGAVLSALRGAQRVVAARASATFSYTLNRATTVTASVDLARAGRQISGVCRRSTRARRSAPTCRRYRRILTRTVHGMRGSNTLTIAGSTFGRAGGVHRLTVVVNPAAGDLASPPQSATFRVRHRR